MTETYRMYPPALVRFAAALCLTATVAAVAAAQVPQHGLSDLSGVYRAISDDMVLPGGLRNAGGPGELPLLPPAADRLKAVDLAIDPARMCQPVGPFRMMARPRVTFELVPVASRGIVAMLFEDVSRGHIRTVHLDQAAPPQREATWHGHSVGRWSGSALLIDTVGLNDRTWLNDAGAQHTDALRLTERLRPVHGGKYLEYRMTAADPGVLAKPYTYTRYFERVSDEIQEDVCED